MNIVAPDVNIKFEGFLTHAGHTYNARSKEEILQIHKDNLRMLKNIKERYIDRYPQLKISFRGYAFLFIGRSFWCGR